MRLIYVAGKFRGADGWSLTGNVRLAEALAFEIAKTGAVPVCPHSMYVSFDRTLNDQYWLEATLALLSRCDAILMCPSWEVSEGARGEHAFAKRVGMPIFYNVPEMQTWAKEYN